MTERARLLFVAWPYANDRIHLGHLAGTFLPADIHRRFLLQQTKFRVCSISGSDEHGTPILQRAITQGRDPSALAGENHRRTVELLDLLRCAPDFFGRTSDPAHARFVNLIFERLLARGECYEIWTERPWCSHCEGFLSDRDLRGICPGCQTAESYSDLCEACGYQPTVEEQTGYHCQRCKHPPELRSVQEYRFRLSNKTDVLRSFVSQNKHRWRLDAVRMTEEFLRQPLRDLAITRSMSYGVRCDRAPTLVFYVWFEALLGYLSMLEQHDSELLRGFLDQQIEGTFFLGKDNIIFHTVVLPAVIQASFDQIPRIAICSSQFLTIRDAKLSKSAGNIHPLDQLLDRFEPDAIRFVLGARLPEQRDSNLEETDFETIIDGTLIDTILNYEHRILSLFHQRFYDQTAQFSCELAPSPLVQRFVQLMHARAHREALHQILEYAKERNQHLSNTRPWAVSETNRQILTELVRTELAHLTILTTMFEPFCPEISQTILSLLGQDPIRLDQPAILHFTNRCGAVQPKPILRTSALTRAV